MAKKPKSPAEIVGPPEAVIDVTPAGSTPAAETLALNSGETITIRTTETHTPEGVFVEQNFATKAAFDTALAEEPQPPLDPFLQRALERSQSPSVGRIVHFVNCDYPSPCAAIITAVHNYACVDLVVFRPHEHPAMPAVPADRVFEGESPFTGPGIIAQSRCWFWPPKV